MVDKSIFFVRPEFFTSLPGETVLGVYKNIEMWEKKEQFRLGELDLQITSHRLIVTSPVNKQLGFIINLEGVIEQKDIKTGLVFKKLIAFKVKYSNQTKVEFKIDKGLDDALVQIKGALNKKAWTKPVVQAQKQQPQMHQGIWDLKKKEEEKQKQQQSVVNQSFKNGDIQSLFQNSKELKEISGYLKENLPRVDKSFERTGLDQILSGLGYFSVITRADSGQNYIDDLAKQIYGMCQELLPKIGGIITLVDLFYFVNKKRQMNLVNPSEILEACSRFGPLGLGAKIVEYNNIKVVESTSLNSDQDFENTIGKYVTYTEGLTPENLSRQLKISPLICRIKLNKACQQGKLILDDRIEGQTYFKNYILDCFV